MSDIPSDPAPEASFASGAPYRQAGRSVHALVYYVLLVTRRQRLLFADGQTAERVAEVFRSEAKALGFAIRALDVRPSTVRIEVQAPPDVPPNKVARDLRRAASSVLREAFPQARDGLFSRDYMVTSMPVLDGDGDAFAALVPRSHLPRKGE